MTHKNPLALTLVQGKRFQKVFRWSTEQKIYKAITGVPQLTPVRLTVNAHGLPDGWWFRVTAVKGPSALNARWHKAKVIDPNTIEINTANLADAAPYAGGGFIEYHAPVDLSGMTGVAVLKESATDTVPALEISTANGRMLLDNVAKTITFDVPGSVLAAMTKYAGIWDWEMSAAGVVSDPRGELQALPPWRMTRELIP